MALTALTALLRARYEALIGADKSRSYSETMREYFVQRSGVPDDQQTPINFYMHTTFDNETIPETGLSERFRLLFIQESAATSSMGWEDAARIWAAVAPTFPIMNRFSPKTGPTATLLVLTITGGNFAPTTTVNFGSTTGLVPTINSTNSLQVTIPGADPNLAAPGQVSVSLTIAGKTSGSLIFTVI